MEADDFENISNSIYLLNGKEYLEKLSELSGLNYISDEEYKIKLLRKIKKTRDYYYTNSEIFKMTKVMKFMFYFVLSEINNERNNKNYKKNLLSIYKEIIDEGSSIIRRQFSALLSENFGNIKNIENRRFFINNVICGGANYFTIKIPEEFLIKDIKSSRDDEYKFNLIKFQRVYTDKMFNAIRESVYYSSDKYKANVAKHFLCSSELIKKYEEEIYKFISEFKDDLTLAFSITPPNSYALTNNLRYFKKYKNFFEEFYYFDLEVESSIINIGGSKKANRRLEETNSVIKNLIIYDEKRPLYTFIANVESIMQICDNNLEILTKNIDDLYSKSKVNYAEYGDSAELKKERIRFLSKLKTIDEDTKSNILFTLLNKKGQISTLFYNDINLNQNLENKLGLKIKDMIKVLKNILVVKDFEEDYKEPQKPKIIVGSKKKQSTGLFDCCHKNKERRFTAELKENNKRNSNIQSRYM